MIINTDHRFIDSNKEEISIPKGFQLTSAPELSSSVGPLGHQDFEHPSYFTISIEYLLDGIERRYEGLFGAHDLLCHKQITAKTCLQNPTDLKIKLGWMFHAGELNISLNSGAIQNYQLEHRSMKSGIQIKENQLHIVCQLFGSNSASPEFVNGESSFEYFIPLELFLFKPATKIYRDESGNIEDFSLGEEDYVSDSKI